MIPRHHRFAITALLALGGLVMSSSGQRIDRDGNGLSDVWASAFTAGSDPSADDDGDGFTNATEELAGTHPRDPADFPRGGRVEMVGDDLRHRWPSVPGIRYQTEVSNDLRNWRVIGPARIGTGAELEAVHRGSDHSSGGVSRSVWTGLSGWGLTVIRNAARDGMPAPDFEDRLHLLEIPQSNPNDDQFGQWIRGWIVAPESGNFTFWIASDDSSEFWLSPNTQAAGRTLIASVPEWTSFREWTKYPSQQSAEIPLEAGKSYYFEVFQRESNGGDHLSVAWTRPGMAAGTREVIGDPHLSSTGESIDELRAAGNGLFLRVQFSHTDSDGDGVNDHEEHLLGLNPELAASVPRQPDLDAALRILDSPSTVTVGVATPRTYESAGSQPARFQIFRAGGIEPLDVAFTLGGGALAGADFITPPDSVRIPGGRRSVMVEIAAVADGLLEPAESVTLSLGDGPGYAVGSPVTAAVTIDDAPDRIHVAALRAAAGVASSGSGSAVLRRAGNSIGGTVALSFSGLGSDQTGAELFVSGDGQPGPVVMMLPVDQVPGMAWGFEEAGGLERSQILQAIDQGRLWVRIRSAGFPGGELVARFSAAPAWDVMPDPVDPGPAPVAPAGVAEAARFLTQATFGPDEQDLTNLMTQGFAQWIDSQTALPPTHHLPYVQARRAELLARDGSDGWQGPRNEAWWQHALTAPDQLRQRTAWALSQIFVVSQFGSLDIEHEGTTRYYDILVDHAFGNYRDLLEAVTLSPMMGTYLSMIRNQKPDPLTGHEPDENYAREVMQLFSVGLLRMHPDGSLVLDADGMPVPTYSQDDTVGLAHVFTGWGPHYDPANPPTWSNGSAAQPRDWFRWGYDSTRPMSFYPEFHDTLDRRILGGVVVPGSADGQARMELALDAIFEHPNTGPFIARQLIQKMVTSNPGPGYIHRVAAAFADNGAGVRGDLGATVRAVLLDPEARAVAPRQRQSFGKPAEPLLRYARLLRLCRPAPPKAGDPRFFLNTQYHIPEQAPLLSPSVFNFFQPVYSSPGRIAASGLLSPEFQIFAETTAIAQANTLHGTIHWGIWTPERDGSNNHYVLRINIDPLVAILDQPGITPEQAQENLIDWLDGRLLFGAMSPGLRQDLRDAFASFPSWFDYSLDRQRARARAALYLVCNSPECFVQK
jgi:uncharacterized protein (DUF1800 family)